MCNVSYCLPKLDSCERCCDILFILAYARDEPNHEAVAGFPKRHHHILILSIILIPKPFPASCIDISRYSTHIRSTTRAQTWRVFRELRRLGDMRRYHDCSEQQSKVSNSERASHGRNCRKRRRNQGVAVSRGGLLRETNLEGNRMLAVNEAKCKHTHRS